jgi:hypothetical protein
MKLQRLNLKTDKETQNVKFYLTKKGQNDDTSFVQIRSRNAIETGTAKFDNRRSLHQTY